MPIIPERVRLLVTLSGIIVGYFKVVVAAIPDKSEK
jgi:hypothetical protein